MSWHHHPQPSAWDGSGRSPSMRYLQVTGDRVKYVGPGTEDKDAAAVRADHPVSCSIATSCSSAARGGGGGGGGMHARTHASRQAGRQASRAARGGAGH